MDSNAMISRRAANFARAYLESPLFPAEEARRITGADILHPEEFLDLYVLLPEAERRILLPLFDLEHYRKMRPWREGETPGPNLLADFFEKGIPLRVESHPLIDIGYMAFLRPDLFRGPLAPAAFWRLFSEDLVDPSPFFEIAHYRASARAPTASPSAVADFILSSERDGASPSPYLDLAAYRAAGTNVPPGALAATLHFIANGDAALVPPGERFDPIWYRGTYGTAADPIERPLWHFLRYGRHTGHVGREAELGAGSSGGEFIYLPRPSDVLERHARLTRRIRRTVEVRRASFAEREVRPVVADDPEALAATLAFKEVGAPKVDVIVPAYLEFDKTVECLAALAASDTAALLRVLVVDDASPDPRYARLANVPGLAYRRNSTNLHFLASVNTAWAATGAPYVLLLNNDAQVLPGAVDALVAALDADPAVAAASPMIVYPNGRLQEAGCTIHADGTTSMVGLFDDPEAPQYARPRDIAYGSGACLMVRRAAAGTVPFDTSYTPAYCEDVDLCIRLRSEGGRIRYIPEARVVHHLSASTMTASGSERRRIALVRRNQQALLDKWGLRLAEDTAVRVLAFYLPQFHPVPQNDLWWGAGFTEWTNVTKARPSFEGHYQPHLPADLGFYDLRLVETMEAQMALARRYGVHGFVMYYYNFRGERILDRPLRNLLAQPGTDFRFCLCWANENWTKHWDGGSKSHALMTQDYDEKTIATVAEDAVAAARLPGAVTIGGKPLFLVYRPLLIPDVAAAAETIRACFRAAGFSGVHLAYVESMETANASLDPSILGFDSSVEFPPQGIAASFRDSIRPLKDAFRGKLYDYAETVVNAVTRPRPAYRRFPTVFPGWDNTARQPQTHTTLVGAAPELFEAYVEAKLDEIDANFVGDERLLFVNAWNEWAEGAHLEPDRAYGHDFLRVLRDALGRRSAA